MGPEYSPPPGSVAQPASDAPSIGAATAVAAGERIEWVSGSDSKAPLLDLLRPVGPGAIELARELAAQAAAKPGIAVAPAPGSAASGTAKPRRRSAPLAVAAMSVALVVAGVGAYWFLHPGAKVATVAKSSPSASPTPSSTPSPTPSPSPSPSPTPSATPAPQTVTAPTVTPTAGHPQAVVITSASGLWLRSSATSASRDNIIGWMPKGATVSVDSVGDFWWHGSYKGQAGYFASKYTE